MGAIYRTLIDRARAQATKRRKCLKQEKSQFRDQGTLAAPWPIEEQLQDTIYQLNIHLCKIGAAVMAPKQTDAHLTHALTYTLTR